jgi:hypothetical protein
VFDESCHPRASAPRTDSFADFPAQRVHVGNEHHGVGRQSGEIHGSRRKFGSRWIDGHVLLFAQRQYGQRVIHPVEMHDRCVDRAVADDVFLPWGVIVTHVCQLQFDSGMSCTEPGDEIYYRVRKGGKDRDVESSAELFGCGSEDFRPARCVAHDSAARTDQSSTRSCRCEDAPPVKERCTEFAFECLDSLGKRRLSNVERACCGDHAAVVDDGEKILDLS